MRYCLIKLIIYREVEVFRPLVVFVITACFTGVAAGQESAPPATVVAVEAKIRDLAETSDFNGRLDANRRVALVARVPGVTDDGRRHRAASL